MFKALIGKGHPEFSTNRQQDAQEFFLHLINMVEVRAETMTREDTLHTPSVCLQFTLSLSGPFLLLSAQPTPTPIPSRLHTLHLPCGSGCT